MAIPTYQDFMLPLLTALGDGKEHRLRDLYLPLAKGFHLSDEQIAQRLPSGQQRVVNNRVGWARTYMLKSGLLSSKRRGFVTITDLGREVLRENPPKINYKFLERFESFREFRQASRNKEKTPEGADEVDVGVTPEETIEAVHAQLRDQLSADLLDKIKDASPYFFEKVVLRLLQAMGYGGVSGSGFVTPKSSDGGIDGIIYEDKLGLDIVCIQAKRWEDTVGRRTVQEFVGSMDLHRSKKGVILTTSKFSGEALEYVNRIEGKKVVLIDGAKLSELMIEHRVGVTPKRTYELLDISEDFFDEDE
jgi:restriction system protein